MIDKKSYSFIDKVILRITTPSAMSIFGVAYVLLPIFNILRSIFLLRINWLILLIFCFLILVLILLFQKSPYILHRFSKFFFKDFFLKHKKFFCYGALLTRDNPFWFSFYLIFSLTSLRLIYQNPDNFYVHFCYVLSVLFRNLVLVPYLGYSFLVRLNKKQSELMIENEGQNEMILWRNTKLTQDSHFSKNFKEWCNWIHELTPSEKSLKIISIISFITTVCWYSLYYIYHLAADFLKVFQENKREFDERIDLVLQNKHQKNEFDDLLKKIGGAMKTKMEILNQEFERYSQMNSFSYNLMYIWNNSFFKIRLLIKIEIISLHPHFRDIVLY